MVYGPVPGEPNLLAPFFICTDIILNIKLGHNPMPWKSSDAKRHTKKASTSKQRRQWTHVANGALSHGASEGSAIRQANGVVARGRHKKGESSMARRKRGGKKHGKKR